MHRGEVEVEMPAAVASKLTVVGRKIRVHRTGERELFDKLGFEGTAKRSSLKLAGCPKVYSSRTEMLRELNTIGLPTYESMRRQRIKSLRRRRPWSAATSNADGGEGGDGVCGKVAAAGVVPDFVERFKEWEAKRRAKVEAKQLERLESEGQGVVSVGCAGPEQLTATHRAPGAVVRSKTSLSTLETEALLARMQADSQRRVQRLRDFDERIAQGTQKLLRYLGASTPYPTHSSSALIKRSKRARSSKGASGLTGDC